jgi:SAM-dependent methyltransferase
MECPFCRQAPCRKTWRKLGYDFWRCAACELIFIDPIPGPRELAAFYEANFFAGGEAGYRNYEREQAWRRKNYQRDIRVIESLAKPGRVLDVGCATGHFLEALPEAWDKYGVEVSAYAGEEARRRFGDRIQIAPLQEARYDDASFDLVTLWETVNHMLDPVGDLRAVHRLLRPGGLMAISVGDVASGLARLTGKFWYHVTPPVHLWYFTPRTMEFLFRTIGFETVKRHYPGKHVDLSTSLERLRETTSSPGLTRVCRWLGARAWAQRTLYINLRDTMYVYARKRADG